MCKLWTIKSVWINLVVAFYSIVNCLLQLGKSEEEEEPMKKTFILMKRHSFTAIY